MTTDTNDPDFTCKNERWAQFRFSVIGALLSSPPPRGELQKRLEALAAKTWMHPITGERTRFSFSTIERWYYEAKNANHSEGPFDVLKRKVRTDSGHHPSISPALGQAIAEQYKDHPGWSCQLHYDNLIALAEEKPELGKVPSYTSVRRYMKTRGYHKRRRRGPADSPGAKAAEHRFESREIRSYESEYTNALWHLDFHHGSMRVLYPDGRWVYPLLLAIMDDHSRLCCHMQWYRNEGARELCHGLKQAFQKRGLPRAILMDNGAAMIARETVQGLARLSILAENTLPYSPYQNGKQESWWNQIEGRLLPMLEAEEHEMTLDRLNYVSQAWVEMEYNRKTHDSTKQTPLHRFLHDKDVARTCPEAERLTEAFTAEYIRKQRRSDGTISLLGSRFEIPSRMAHIEKLSIRCASWNLSRAWISDPGSGKLLTRIYPQDKVRNAEGNRAAKSTGTSSKETADTSRPPAPSPLLQKILREYNKTGLPPAYQPGPDPEKESDKQILNKNQNNKTTNK